jgi:predicted RNase H-like HicB family nuclease
LWSEEDNAYVATCPDFPGLSAFGETPEEAFAEGMLCLQLFEESLLASGDPLPEATEVSEFSGQTRLRIPKTLHRALAQKADTEGVSLNTWIVMLLSERNSTAKLVDQVCSRIEIVEQVVKVHTAESKKQIKIHRQAPLLPHLDVNGNLTQKPQKKAHSPIRKTDAEQ